MDPRWYVARADHVAARKIGEEMMIMSGLDSSLFSLNSTATLLWEAADGVTPLEAIVEQRICGEFDVEPGDALSDALALVEELARHGLLRLSSVRIQGSPRPGAPA